MCDLSQNLGFTVELTECSYELNWSRERANKIGTQNPQICVPNFDTLYWSQFSEKLYQPRYQSKAREST